MTLTLTDGTVFNNAAVKHVDTFQYSRKFSTTGWMTTVLPVALKYSDWSSKFEIANITGVSPKLDSNGKVQSFTMSKSILKEGSTTNPNQPYLIRAKVANSTTAQTIKKTNCDVYPSIPKELTFTSGDYKFVVKGTYEKVTSNSIYTSSKEVWSPGSSVGSFRAFVAVVKEEPAPDPQPVDPEPDTLQEAYVRLSNRVTALEQALNEEITGLWKVIGDMHAENNETIASNFQLVSTGLNDLNSRLNTVETALENLTPGSSSSNPQYESRISALENQIGNISIEVID